MKQSNTATLRGLHCCTHLKRAVRLQAAAIFLVGMALHAMLPPAMAASGVCGPRVKLIKMVRDRYGERSVEQPVNHQRRSRFQTFTSSSGHWTTIENINDRLACIYASGVAG